MKRVRRVKIVATLGPASSSPEKIKKLFEAGTDTFRINMSHTPHPGLKQMVHDIRAVETEFGRPIAILVDLQGPKFRIGEISEEPVTLETGNSFILDNDQTPGNDQRAFLPHPDIFKTVKVGDNLLLDDGKVKLTVTSTDKNTITSEIIVGGSLSSKKGISLPDTIVPVPAITEKDRRDLDYALGLNIDWIALSFVQRADDVAEAKKICRGRAAVMAKIEKPSAVTSLNEILEVADGIMVARGDLGVEMPVEKVPGLQKQMVLAARQAGKPVVIATQMLESMITSPVPTRAEVSDVANAIFDGADAIMLSAESAVGDYPEEAVATMDRIAREVEQDPTYHDAISSHKIEPLATGADAISAALHQISDTLNLAAIVCYTSSGTTGIRAARERPQRPIVALTPRVETGRRLALIWGLHCVLTEDANNLDDMVDRACRISFQEKLARPGQRIIISAGMPFGTPGATNILRIAFVGDDGSGGF
ncbi:MAG: pyruvate kinase [Rhizobiales bacterium]|nr:pyruvate kinase [Hyphomicrobiales bacterium]